MTVAAAMMTATVVTATVTGCIMDVGGIMLMNMYRIEVHMDGIMMRVSGRISMQRIAMMTAQRIELQGVAMMLTATVMFVATSVCCRQIGARKLKITCAQGFLLAGVHDN